MEMSSMRQESEMDMQTIEEPPRSRWRSLAVELKLKIRMSSFVKLVNKKLFAVLQASLAAEKRWTASCRTYEAPSA